jgi:hypothetical protein
MAAGHASFTTGRFSFFGHLKRGKRYTFQHLCPPSGAAAAETVFFFGGGGVENRPISQELSAPRLTGIVWCTARRNAKSMLLGFFFFFFSLFKKGQHTITFSAAEAADPFNYIYMCD